jgi:hypothetical protein
MNVETNNVEGLYMAITCIIFKIFLLKVVVIISAIKIINVLCDDNVMNLTYVSIVPLCAYTPMVKCFFGSMKFIVFDVCGLKCVSLKHNI